MRNVTVQACNVYSNYCCCSVLVSNLWSRRTIRNTAFTHSSKKSWNNFWHFSASSSFIIWPAFWFAPGSKRSISKQLVLQSYNNNVASVPSTTRSTRALAEVFARKAVPCDCFAPPGTNQIDASLCCYYNWAIVANHIRAFWGSWHHVDLLRLDSFRDSFRKF